MNSSRFECNLANDKTIIFRDVVVISNKCQEDSFNGLNQMIETLSNDFLVEIQKKGEENWVGTLVEEYFAKYSSPVPEKTKILTFLRFTSLNLIIQVLLYQRIKDENRILPDDYQIMLKDLSTNGKFTFPITNLELFLQKVNSIISISSLFDRLDILLPINERKSNQFYQSLAQSYYYILSQKSRRPLGQFWTPQPIARFMTRWLLLESPRVILDPCFGPGIFFWEILREFQENPEMVTNLVGFELHPLLFLIGICTGLWASQTIEGSSLNFEFLNCNFLTSSGKQKKSFIKSPSVLLPLLKTRTISSLPSLCVDAIVCNPPYTRHHLISREIKEKFKIEINSQFDFKFSQLSSLFNYFFYKSSTLLAKNGRMAFIVPTVIFESRSSAFIKELIKKTLSLRAIIFFSEEQNNLFDGVDTSGCIILLEGKRPTKKTRVQIIRVQGPFNSEEMLKNITREETTYIHGDKILLLQKDLSLDSNWTDLSNSRDPSNKLPLIPLKKLGRIMRGIATGANKFFTLTEEELLNNKLERKFFVPTVTKTRYLASYIFDKAMFEEEIQAGHKCWLLYCHDPPEVLQGTNIWKYLIKGEKERLPDRALIKSRKVWYYSEKRELPKILFTYLSRDRSRFIYNTAGVRPLNVFLAFYPDPIIFPDENSDKLKAFLAILNSKFSREELKRVGRCYGGNTIKVEPRELDKMRVIDPSFFSSKNIEELSAMFDELVRTAKTEGELEVKRRIDIYIKESFQL